ncbi:hypothetical protein C8N46_102419 [Kordia periserrulae]|uniref:Uncharacterized protein n=1 Tax=Kordia periserrulae TaxID=701523 RepID=A0A2T6C3Y8_9FLAO|nr:hypothetical protein [Kordia periserrulae]PTX63018.1 hypothetical protein C8N46_102419 [Kordia periserrulae]
MTYSFKTINKTKAVTLAFITTVIFLAIVYTLLFFFRDTLYDFGFSQEVNFIIFILILSVILNLLFFCITKYIAKLTCVKVTSTEVIIDDNDYLSLNELTHIETKAKNTIAILHFKDESHYRLRSYGKNLQGFHNLIQALELYLNTKKSL